VELKGFRVCRIIYTLPIEALQQLQKYKNAQAGHLPFGQVNCQELLSVQRRVIPRLV
jgi:hypothetical protein